MSLLPSERDPLEISSVRWRYGTWALWLTSWWGLKCLLWDQDARLYVLCMSLAIHLRIPPPFGQIPPLLDPLLVYMQGFSSLFCLVFGGLSLQLFVSRPSTESDLWSHSSLLLSSISCGLFSWRRTLAVDEIRTRIPVTKRLTIRRPWLTKCHPYLYYFFRQLPGHSTDDVVIERLHPQCLKVPVDVWYLPDGAPRAGVGAVERPVLFLIHGGAWRGGEARCSPQGPFLHALAAEGFLIVSCEYRRRVGTVWPNQLEDCSAAWEWFIHEGAAAYNANLADVTIAGTSAGGHLAALLLAKLLQEPPQKNLTLRAAMLFYPALDPADRFSMPAATVRLPFSCPFLGVRYYQMSALEWFFELMVLHGNAHLWPQAEPIQQMQQIDKERLSQWPPMFISHGDCDGIVPIEHSINFLNRLASGSTSEHSGRRSRFRSCDELLRVPGGRHTFEMIYGELSDSTYDAALSWLHGIRSRSLEIPK